MHENDPFERFYGFGDDTSSATETSYMSDTTLLFGSSAINLPHALHMTTQTRVRVARLRKGGVDCVAPLVSDPRFSGTPGLDGATVVGQRFGLRYDTRDANDIPTEGHYVEGGGEVIDEALGSSTSYVKYGIRRPLLHAP